MGHPIILVLILATVACASQLNEAEEIKHRQKRYLLYPFSGTFKTVYSFAIPWKLGPKQDMGVGWNFQFQYPLPYNTTAITNFPTLSRENRNRRDTAENPVSDRAMFYEGIERLLDQNGINGRQCVLRSICECAESDFPSNDNSLLDQVLYVILTPNYKDGPDPYLDEAYANAQRAGEYGVDCQTAYTDCDMTTDLFHMFSDFYQ
ncbi:uncharacterized protein LOC143195258 [Rhynchophorus ferrugineus]|uniref:uncharacterized protein LOC143195258 n=1 Tax=Rhynchophorus ferrugineus TaxID=354439 RepID=UPI003FCE94FC